MKFFPGEIQRMENGTIQDESTDVGMYKQKKRKKKEENPDKLVTPTDH